MHMVMMVRYRTKISPFKQTTKRDMGELESQQSLSNYNWLYSVNLGQHLELKRFEDNLVLELYSSSPRGKAHRRCTASK
jgi:hypothetical protein